MVGDGVEVTVLSVEGETVRIGITAPRQISVYRKEVYLAIQQSNKEAAKSEIDPRRLTELLKREDKRKNT
jgi:carbon storage regulator